MIPSDDHDLLDPFEPDPGMPSQRRTDRLSGFTVGLVGLLAAVAVAGVTLFALGGDETPDPTEPTDDQAAVADSADDLASSTRDGAGTGTADEADPSREPVTRTETGSETETQTDPAGPTADGSVTTTDTPTTTATVSNASTTSGTGGATTSTIAGSSDTVEADETTGDPTGDDPTADPNGDPNAGGTPGPPPTPSTAPAPTTGTCRIPAAGFDGRAGVIDLGTDGACGALSATVQAVNPRDDLAGTDWGRDIRVCQRHPAAGEVEIGIRTGSETIDLTGGWSRSAAEAAADPIQSITVEFSDQATPETGPRPVVLCRTDDAELSIVHRPAT